jgi:hypothetical protein
VTALGDEALEMRARIRDGVGPRDTDGVEALFARGRDKLLLDRRRRRAAQKSRLA